MMRAPAVVAVLVNMVFGLQYLDFNRENELQHVELFAGDCSVTCGEAMEGRRCIGLDIKIGGETMDLTTSTGFIAALYQTCRLTPGSGWLAAPVCSSFVFMSRGTTKRSATRPLGEESYESVRVGNILTARTLVILMVAHALRCFWVLEQPKGSVMELHPCFQEVLGRMTVWKHCLQMQQFGAPTAKPTWLYASDAAIDQLEDFRPRHLPPPPPVEMAVIYTDSSGKQRVKGGKHLKASQSYPLPFGKALARLRSRHHERLRSAARAALKRNMKNYRTVRRNTRADALAVAFTCLMAASKSKTSSSKAEHKKVQKTIAKSKLKQKETKKAKEKKEKKVKRVTPEKKQKEEQKCAKKAAAKEEKEEKEEKKQKVAEKVEKVKKHEKKESGKQAAKTPEDSSKRVAEKSLECDANKRPARRVSFKSPEYVVKTPPMRTVASPSPVPSAARSVEAWMEEAAAQGMSLEDFMSDVSTKYLEAQVESRMKDLVKTSKGKGVEDDDEEDANEDASSESSSEETKSNSSEDGEGGITETEIEDSLSEGGPEDDEDDGENEAEYDKFCRQCLDRKKFPLSLAPHFVKNKLDLFRGWLEVSQSWSRLEVEFDRRAERKLTSKKSRAGIKARDILKMYPKEKAEDLMKRLKSKGLFHFDDDFPNDEEEIFYYVGQGNEFKDENITTDGVAVKIKETGNKELADTLTGDDGLLRNGAVPAVQAHNEAGEKALIDAVAGSTEKAPKEPKPKRDPATKAEPKTVLDKARDEMENCLRKSAEGRKYAISLQATEYSGDLATKMMAFSEKMEKCYKALVELVQRKEDKEAKYSNLFSVIADKISWYETAEGAAKGLLSSFKPKKGKKKAKNGEPEETERTKTSKEAKP
ncbi:unnamed protein product [Durusdinium trenchii]|uniref:Uncharacterized protein n=1 Tax=Durusdinium trenchii TaxID=1381693 RepID=A0ABP0RTJ2_9DINO